VNADGSTQLSQELPSPLTTSQISQPFALADRKGVDRFLQINMSVTAVSQSVVEIRDLRVEKEP
jgi:hypothetical protein